MRYDGYLEMFSKGMERVTGKYEPERYESMLIFNAMKPNDIQKLVDALVNSEYDMRRILELKEYLSDYSGCSVDEYAWSFMRSIDLMENLNLFCARNEVPEVAKAYIIDKIILTVAKVWRILLTT